MTWLRSDPLWSTDLLVYSMSNMVQGTLHGKWAPAVHQGSVEQWGIATVLNWFVPRSPLNKMLRHICPSCPYPIYSTPLWTFPPKLLWNTPVNLVPLYGSVPPCHNAPSCTGPRRRVIYVLVLE